MTKKIRWILVAALVSAVATPALAGKIGFVEVERAMVSVKEGRALLVELEAWAKPRQEELDKLRDRVLELQQQIAQQRTVATADALRRLEEDEIEARRRHEDRVRVLNRDLEARQTQLLKEVATKLNSVVTDYAKANDFDSVFIFKSSMLIYLSETVDLTDTIIKLYDERFPPSS